MKNEKKNLIIQMNPMKKRYIMTVFLIDSIFNPENNQSQEDRNLVLYK
jgi:hypothetical protein